MNQNTLFKKSIYCIPENDLMSSANIHKYHSFFSFNSSLLRSFKRFGIEKFFCKVFILSPGNGKRIRYIQVITYYDNFKKKNKIKEVSRKDYFAAHNNCKVKITLLKFEESNKIKIIFIGYLLSLKNKDIIKNTNAYSHLLISYLQHWLGSKSTMIRNKCKKNMNEIDWYTYNRRYSSCNLKFPSKEFDSGSQMCNQISKESHENFNKWFNILGNLSTNNQRKIEDLFKNFSIKTIKK
uniref:Uncharacterized protein n=1 Tax=Parastrongyloides trichosuri TaxID=131310 RepID=A0A0N4ZNW9_PARTI